jgi:hypothetical protein
MVLQVLGWILVAVGAIAGVRANLADRALQEYRLPNTPPSAYWFVPLRIREDLYRPEGHYLVGRAWRMTGVMYGSALLGAILIVLGQ